MAKLTAPFSEVSAINPYSQSPTSYTVQELGEPGPDNYSISLPYSKRLIAQDAVNQAAALVLTNAGNARRLGVGPGQWIFIESFKIQKGNYYS